MEVHGANVRMDAYGGTIENRAGLVAQEIGAERTGCPDLAGFARKWPFL